MGILGWNWHLDVIIGLRIARKAVLWEDWCFGCHFQLFSFGSHLNGDAMRVIWNEEWCGFHAM